MHCRNKKPLFNIFFNVFHVLLQVVGRHFQEEMVIYAMQTVEELLKRKIQGVFKLPSP